MGMEAETGEGLSFIVDQIEEDKRLQELAEIARAHQARDGAVPLTTTSVNNVSVGAGQ